MFVATSNIGSGNSITVPITYEPYPIGTGRLIHMHTAHACTHTHTHAHTHKYVQSPYKETHTQQVIHILCTAYTPFFPLAVCTPLGSMRGRGGYK